MGLAKRAGELSCVAASLLTLSNALARLGIVPNVRLIRSAAALTVQLGGPLNQALALLLKMLQRLSGGGDRLRLIYSWLGHFVCLSHHVRLDCELPGIGPGALMPPSTTYGRQGSSPRCK